MLVIEHSGPSPLFDESAIEAVLLETGLPLAEGTTARLKEELEHVAYEYYWREYSPGDPARQSRGVSFDALADASVTPSRLRNRLIKIERAATRIFAGTSPKPLPDKVAELLNRLGRDWSGRPLTRSGTEVLGHGGSERSAVWLCLVRAVMVHESPRRAYRHDSDERPWASQRLEGAIQALANFVQNPQSAQGDVNDAARAIHRWTGWSLELVQEFLAHDRARHRRNEALDTAICDLARIYSRAFGKKPSIYRRSARYEKDMPTPWIRFLRAVLYLILGPGKCPPHSTLEWRWERLRSSD